MRKRVLEACLLAYPRSRRERDGEVLRDLAFDLGEDHGFVREAFSLVRGGLVDRITSRRESRASWSKRRRVTVSLVVAIGFVSVLSMHLIGAGARVEVEEFACADQGCADVEALVAARIRAGWGCAPDPEPDHGGLAWRCTQT